MVQAWALQWHSKNLLDGERKRIIFDGCVPKLFRTRSAARAFANEKYGYIKDRPDLLAEPHGWRFPQPIKVIVQVSE